MRSTAVLVVMGLSIVACTATGGESRSAGSEVVGAPGPAQSGTAAGESAEDEAVLAPEFPDGLEWINTDRPITLEELRGKVVLLDFWTYGCVNCIHIIPDLQRLEEEFAEELVVIGVHSAKFEGEKATEGIRDIVLRYGVRHPVVNDADFEIWRAYGVRAWPTVWLIHPDGSLVGRLEGEGVYGVVAPVIAELVAGSSDIIVRGRFENVAERAPESVLFYPGKVEVEPSGPRIAIADTGHNQVLLVDRLTGQVEAVYGSGDPSFIDGVALEAGFSAPQGMAFVGGALFVADTGNHAIRRIDLQSGLVTTIAGTGKQGGWPPSGGPAAFTALYSPWDLLGTDRGSLIVAMAGSHQLWEVDVTASIAEPWVGNGGESTLNGPRLDAELAQPSGLAVSPDGVIYLADSESSSIRVVDGETVSLLAGAASDLFSFGLVDDVGEDARFQHPLGVEWWDGRVYVADTYNDAIRQIDPASRTVVTVAGGTPGWADGQDPRFDEPGGISVADGVLFIADTNNHAVRTLDLRTGVADTLILKGIEAFRRLDPAEGRTLAPVSLAEGNVTLLVDVVFPDGYKLNPEAPASFAWEGTAGTVATGRLLAVDPDLPLGFEAEVRQSGSFTLELDLVYCDEQEESVCLFEQAVLELPVTVGGSDTSATLRHVIDLP